jgi:glycosyltransferase involved in cell wall biosynthesis
MSTEPALRVLHAATHEHTGAGRAAVRTHAAVAKAGVASSLLVLFGSGAAPGIEVLADTAARRRLAVARRLAEEALLSRQRDGDGAYRSLGLGGGPGLAAIRARARDLDLIHLHWIPGLLGVADLPALPLPVVWSFHDAWPICGAEHYTDLERPRAGYLPGSRRPGARGPDLDRWAWRRKRAAWRGFRPVIVCSNRWMAGEVRASVLFRDCDVHVVANPLDTALFAPRDRAAARNGLALPADRRLLLFGAWGALTDRRKGFHVLAEALGRLAARGFAQTTDLVVFGASGREPVQGFRTHWLGQIDDEAQLRLLYQACDAIAIPSLQDNLPYTLVEAMACGLPVVASATGGIPDLLRHGDTGLLAAPGDAQQLAERLGTLLADTGLQARLRDAARRLVEEACGDDSVGARYAEVYRAASAAATARRSSTAA